MINNLNQISILDLPTECLVKSFSCLYPADLLTASLACKYFSEIASESSLWKKWTRNYGFSLSDYPSKIPISFLRLDFI